MAKSKAVRKALKIEKIYLASKMQQGILQAKLWSKKHFDPYTSEVYDELLHEQLVERKIESAAAALALKMLIE